MSIIRKLKNGFLCFWDSNYRWKIMANYGFYDNLSDEEYLKKMFKASIGKELNLDNPITFNEKLQWLKLYDRKDIYTVMVDKYLVKKYVADIIGEEYIIPTIGVWDNPNEIDFDVLPNQFVLKCNHNSGLGMCICKDKSKLNIANVKAELRKGLAQDYYLHGREWPYKNVQRKIIAEQYLSNGASDDTLSDYKLMCFNGKLRFLEIHIDRFKAHKQFIYDEKGDLLPFNNIGFSNQDAPKVEMDIYIKMRLLAEKLAEKIPVVRVDFYNVSGKIYFGELTFFDGSGFYKIEPEEWDIKLGEWIKISPVHAN